MPLGQVANTNLLIQITGPRQVTDGGIDAPPKILKNHIFGGMRGCPGLRDVCLCTSFEDCGLR